MSSLLNPPSHGGRGRSASRERSRSRARAPSKHGVSHQYPDDYDSDSEDERYVNVPGLRNTSAANARDYEYYFVSDTEEPQGVSSKGKKGQRPRQHESDSKYRNYSASQQHPDFNILESEDDFAVDDHGNDRELVHGGHYYHPDPAVQGSKARSRSRGRQYGESDHLFAPGARRAKSTDGRRPSKSRTRDSTRPQSQYFADPGYGRIDPYAQHPEHAAAQAYGAGGTHQARPEQQNPYIDLNAWAEIPECERPGFVPSPNTSGQHGGYTDHSFPASQPPTSSSAYTRPMPGLVPTTAGGMHPAAAANYATIPQSQYVPSSHYGQAPAPAQNLTPQSAGAPTSSHHRAYSMGAATVANQGYTQPQTYQYTQPENIKYSSKPPKPVPYNDKIQYSSKPIVSELKPSYAKAQVNRQGRPHSKSVSAEDRIKIPGSFPDNTHQRASPRLEPYRGTYGGLSPMPWPTYLPDDGLSDMEALDASDKSKLRRKGSKRETVVIRDKSRERKEQGRRASSQKRAESTKSPKGAVTVYYDAQEDVKLFKAALVHSPPDSQPFIKVLPYLTFEEIVDLRAEYSTLVRLGGKGVNLVKHIDSKFTGKFAKICYETMKGRWESEISWINYYRTSRSARPEFLIEALLGRSNSDIWAISKAFRDKRYGHNLKQCLKAELGNDVFRDIILLALEVQRQPETVRLSKETVYSDARELAQSLVSREGGEANIIKIVVLRSNAHLREVMIAYERAYKQDFVKMVAGKYPGVISDALRHILFGAYDRAVRDAQLVHQAICKTDLGRDRTLALMSRILRLHWEPQHLEQVKNHYRSRYGKRIEQHIKSEIIEGGTSSGWNEKRTLWAELCIELVKSSSVHVENHAAGDRGE
ncbi:hypothetical protein FQN57_006469 [Myotisia sp. PD_48]|nr:hypothetical protein FQN57_006469 [Myotisia sp. PD_48]